MILIDTLDHLAQQIRSNELVYVGPGKIGCVWLTNLGIDAICYVINDTPEDMEQYHMHFIRHPQSACQLVRLSDPLSVGNTECQASLGVRGTFRGSVRDFRWENMES